MSALCQYSISGRFMVVSRFKLCVERRRIKQEVPSKIESESLNFINIFSIRRINIQECNLYCCALPHFLYQVLKKVGTLTNLIHISF